MVLDASPRVGPQAAAQLGSNLLPDSATGRCRIGTAPVGWRGFVAYRRRGLYSGVSHAVRRGGQPLVRAAARWRRRSNPPPWGTDSPTVSTQVEAGWS